MANTKETADGKSIFNFVENSPIVKQTEEKIIKEYERMDEQEQDQEPAPEPAQEPIAQNIPAVAQIAPGEPTKNINIALPISLHTKLKILCAQKGEKIKDVVPLIIKEYVDQATGKNE